MPQLTSQELRQWYQQFAKELYEKAQIDVTRKEDLGRIKNFYFTKWDDDEPMGPEGEYRYAYISHNGLTYDNPPPSIENPDEYMRWMTSNLEPDVSDAQIEKLLEMSQAGTLMVFAPGKGYRDLQQVHTDEFGKVTVSLPISMMDGSGKNRPDIPEERKLPLPPGAPPKEARPEDFGLKGCPPKPVPPKNPNPGFLSWLGYILGFDSEYAKKVRYEKEAPTYEERFDKWFNRLDDDAPGVSEYKEAKHLREQYLQEVQDFKSKPLGLANAIDNGYFSMIKNRLHEIEEMDADGLYPTMKFMVKEQAYLKKQHSRLPQGKILSKLEETVEKLQYGDRTRQVVKNLVGNQPQPKSLKLWLKRGVFNPETYNPKGYELPKPPKDANLTIDEQEAFQKNMQNLAEVASFAALSHMEVVGEPKFDGFTAEETAKLNYTMILNNIFTQGRIQSANYMDFLEPGRQKGREAVEAYQKGHIEPLAELLRNSIRQTNREAACVNTPEDEHGMNTLYLIGRMWDVMQKDSKLMEAVGLTPEEIQETQANIALHKAITKALEAKQALLEYTLHKRDMTPEQLKQAGCEVLFGNMVCNNVLISERNQSEIIAKKPEYNEQLQIDAENSNTVQKQQALTAAKEADDRKAIAILEAEIADMSKKRDMAQKRCHLLLFDRPGHACNRDLLNADWVQGAKDSLLKDCSLDKILTMKREDLGKLLGSRTDFADAFAPINQASKKEDPAAEKTMEEIQKAEKAPELQSHNLSVPKL